MSKSCKPLHPGLFLLGAATAALVFAAPQTCAEAFRQGLAPQMAAHDAVQQVIGGPLLVSLLPFLVVSALIMRSGAGEVLGVLLWPVVRCIGLRSRSAGSVLLIGLVGGFAPAATATAEAVRSRELTPQEASALLPACICSGPSFVILTVGEQLLGSRTAQLQVPYSPAAMAATTSNAITLRWICARRIRIPPGNCSGASGSPTRAMHSACWSQTRRYPKQPTPTGCGSRLSVRQQTDGQILQG